MANVRGRTAAGLLTGERVTPLMPTRVKIVPGSGWTEDSNGHYLLVDLEGFNEDKVRLEVNTTAGHLTITGERQVNEREQVYIDENFPLPENSDVDKITGKFDGEILYVTVPKVVAVVQQNKVPEIAEAVKEPEIVETRKEHQIVEPKKEHEIVQESKKPEMMENQKTVAAPAAENACPRVPRNNDVKYTNKYGGKYVAEAKRILGNGRIFFTAENIKKWEEDNGYLRNSMEVLKKNKGMVITAVVAFSLGMLVSHKFGTGK